MIILCNILHRSYTVVPVQLAKDQLLRITALIDKYDCSEISIFVSHCWIMQMSADELEDLLDLISVSFFLRCADRFRDLTTRLNLEHCWDSNGVFANSNLPSEVQRESEST